MLLALLAIVIDDWVAAEQLEALGTALGLLVLVISAQDVAVDAWALELLPAERVSYASACQTIGMSAGNVIGHPLLLAVSSAGDATPSLARFCLAVAVAHAIASLVSLLVPEATMRVDWAISDGAKPSDGHLAWRLAHLWRELRAFSADASVRALGVVCFWQRVAVIPLDAAAAVYYMRLPGARREHLAAFTVAQAPVGLLASLCVARLLANEQSDTAAAMRAGYAMLLVSSLAAPLVLGGAIAPLGTPTSIASLLVLCTLFAAGNKVWWTAQGAAFNHVVMQRGSSHAIALNLQLLNSLSNLGKLWPRPVALALVDLVGFVGASALLAGVGVVAWPAVRRALATASNGMHAQQHAAPPAPEGAPAAASMAKRPPGMMRLLAVATPVALAGLVSALQEPPSPDAWAAVTAAGSSDGTAWLTRKYEWLSWLVPLTNAFRFGGDAYASETMHSALWNGTDYDLQYTNRLVANATLDVVRRLTSPGNASTAASPRLPSSAPRLLDAGCGWGATAFFLEAALDEAARLRAEVHARFSAPLAYDGVTLSTAQAQRANATAAARGLGARCRFLVRSYEAPLPADDYSVIVALESIEHASNLSAVLHRFERALLPGGALLIATDLARDATVKSSNLWRVYQQHWCGPHTHAWAPPLAHDVWQRAASAAGLRVAESIDLSSRLPRRSLPALVWYLMGLRAMHSAAELWGTAGTASVLSTQLGGVARELLLHGESIQYAFLVLSKPP